MILQSAYTKKWYNSKVCLLLQVTSRGIFLEMAEADPEKKKNGMPTFKWKEKLTILISDQELLELKYIIEVWFGFKTLNSLELLPNSELKRIKLLIGEEAYFKLLYERFPDTKYKNYLLFHADNRKGTKNNSQFGISYLKSNISLMIKKEKTLSFPITDRFTALSIINWMDYIINKSFEYEADTSNQSQ